MKKLILAAAFACMSIGSFANEFSYPLLSFHTPDQEVVMVEKCWGEEMCVPLGQYPIEAFDSNPGRRKLRSIVSGAAELIVSGLAAYISGWVHYGVTAGKGGMAITVLATGAAGVTTSVVIKSLSPFYQWQLSNVEKILDREAIEKGMLNVSFEDDFEMVKFEKKFKYLMKEKTK